MITRVSPANPTVPRSADADHSLPPAEYFFASGNSCIVEPVMRKDRKNPGMCYIGVTYAWKTKPTPEDESEMESEINSMMKKPPDVTLDGTDLRGAARFRDEFLNPAKRH